MDFKVPITLSEAEKSLIELYSLLNEDIKSKGDTWRLIKKEELTVKGVATSGNMEVGRPDGTVISSDNFTVVCEDAPTKEDCVAVATIKLIILCCTSLGYPINFQYAKQKKEFNRQDDTPWKEVASSCSLDPVVVSSHHSIRSLMRYCKSIGFPIHQALEETKEAFGSERVTTKQFFEFVFGESNYRKLKSISKKRKAERVDKPLPTQVTPQVTPQVEVILPVQEGRHHNDVKYVIGKLISQGVNSQTFPIKYPELTEKYGNFQYFCIHASEDELKTVMINE
jgi:hypothetical protein